MADSSATATYHGVGLTTSSWRSQAPAQGQDAPDEAIRRWPAAIGSTSAELNPALLSPDPPRSVTPRIEPERADVIRQNQEPQTVAMPLSVSSVVPG
jgi:hypothetical protein